MSQEHFSRRHSVRLNYTANVYASSAYWALSRSTSRDDCAGICYPYDLGYCRLGVEFPACGHYCRLRVVDTAQDRSALKANSCLRPGSGSSARLWRRSIPAFALAFLTSPQIEIVYRPLASPPILVFFIFIILSTLRLSPWIGALSGIVASVTYLCAAWYLGWRLPVPGAPAPVTQSGVSLYAVTLLVGGIVAGAVAREVRKHVQAALREAETRRQLKAIQHDLQVAQSIQQSLLPRETASHCRIRHRRLEPARRTIRAATISTGKPFPMGRMVVSLADVTGHGIGPALLATSVPRLRPVQFSTAQDLP